jgi:hypothetical protein
MVVVRVSVLQKFWKNGSLEKFSYEEKHEKHVAYAKYRFLALEWKMTEKRGLVLLKQHWMVRFKTNNYLTWESVYVHIEQ